MGLFKVLKRIAGVPQVGQQVIVSDSSAGRQVTTLIQYGVSVLGGIAIGKGWLDADAVSKLGASAAVVVPAVIGIGRVWKNNEVKKVMEAQLPDSVATRR